LLDEGNAMLQAVVSDLAAVAPIDISVMWDQRLSLQPPAAAQADFITSAAQHWQQFRSRAALADASLLVAPECDGWLLHLARIAEQSGATLLSPDAEFIARATDKLRLADHWRRQEVPTPRTLSVPTSPASWADLPDRLIIKPVDGAGSSDVRLLRTVDVPLWLASAERSPDRYCLQEFVPGRAASCAALYGPTGITLLPPCWQQVEPPDFIYRGGSMIQEPPLIRRAQHVARRALETLPVTRGYVGVDLILGRESDGSRDVAIEVNPRLTTSYVGLRHVCRTSLAAAMIDAASVRHVALSCREGPLQFDASGRVWF
jgi:predicted ATP-grasp superfamily ATP-dependent carboligase